MAKVTLCGIAYDVQSGQEDLHMALSHVGRDVFVVCTPNAEIAGRALRDAALCDAVATADLVLPDGDGVVLAGKLAGRQIPCRRTGVGLAMDLLAAADARGLRVYLLGGTQETVALAASYVRARYPGLVLCGKHHGYFNVSDTENDMVIDEIQSARPDITLVCMGAPRQELWMADNRHRLPVGVYGGFGGVLTLLAKKTRRAPRIWQRLHLEWLYRTLREPARLRRLTVIPPYLWRAWRSRGDEGCRKDGTGGKG